MASYSMLPRDTLIGTLSDHYSNSWSSQDTTQHKHTHNLIINQRMDNDNDSDRHGEHSIPTMVLDWHIQERLCRTTLGVFRFLVRRSFSRCLIIDHTSNCCICTFIVAWFMRNRPERVTHRPYSWLSLSHPNNGIELTILGSNWPNDQMCRPCRASNDKCTAMDSNKNWQLQIQRHRDEADVNTLMGRGCSCDGSSHQHIKRDR